MSEIDGHVGQIPVQEHVENTQFPDGLRVLAIDDNVVCLLLLQVLLKKCRYKVTATTNTIEALEMLRQNKDNFDIVITDVKRLDMDGFSLLDIIGLEMDLPVIMISADDNKSTVMKGIRHGARDYLLKPVRMEEIKNIWQHVVRKSLSDPNKSCITEGVTDKNPVCTSKRDRDSSNEKAEDETNTRSNGDSFAQKKHRVTWTHLLHNKFVDAIEQLGENAVPKQIFKFMNEPGISRENVASHLQKFRKMLKKKNTKMSQESNNDGDSNKNGGQVPSTTILSFGNQGHDAANRHKRSGINGNSNAEMTHLGDGIPKSDPFRPSHMDLRPLFQPPNQQNVLLQHYPLTPQLANQMRPRMHVPVLGNAPLQTPLWMGNYPPVPEFNGLKFQSFNSGPKMLNNLTEVSSRFPSYSAGSEPGPSGTPFVLYPPNSYPSSATSFFDQPYQMLGGASTGMTPIPQQNSAVMPAQNLFMGQQEGRNFVYSNGRGDLDLRGQINGCPFGIQGPVIQDSNVIGRIDSMQPSQDNLQTEDSFHHHSHSLSDDDLSAMVKQFDDDGIKSSHCL